MLLSDLKIKDGRAITKDNNLIECKACNSSFSRDFVKSKIRKWGKDQQSFYTTKHCPNCDKRISLRDEQVGLDALRKRIDQLTRYASQARMTGEREEYNDAINEIDNLKAEFESLRNSLPVKDSAILPQSVMNMRSRNAELKKELEKARNAGDKASEKFFLEAIKENEDAEKRYMSNRDSDIDVKEQIIRFFSEHPNPLDSEVHVLAASIGLEPDILETMIYALLSEKLKRTSDYGETRVKIIRGEYSGQIGIVENSIPDGFLVRLQNGKLVEVRNNHLMILDSEPDTKGFDVRDIEKETIANKNFRKVVFTGKHEQLVLMSLQPSEDIGMEVHPNVDQFFRIEEGIGKLVIKDKGEFPLKAGSSMLVVAGTYHNVVNTGNNELKLYTVYAPPNHPNNRVQATKAIALAEENN